MLWDTSTCISELRHTTGANPSYDLRLCYQIEGMTCASCVHMIERTLMGVDGVTKAVVALSTNKGRIEFDPTKLGPRDIIQVIEVHTILHITLVACSSV